jgi:hypothetical protein
MPPSSTFEKDSLNLDLDIHLIQPITPLLLDEMYGITKGPCQYLKEIGTIKLDDFILEFDS